MKLNEIPTTEHFAVLTQNSRTIHHEGDERSRTHPGHGYPAYTETIESINYQAFATKEELESFLQHESRWGRTCRVFKVTPMMVRAFVEVTE